MKKVRYHREARAEYAAAAAWYDDRCPGVGADFIDAVERAEAAIAATPRTWPMWADADPRVGKEIKGRNKRTPKYLSMPPARSKSWTRGPSDTV